MQISPTAFNTCTLRCGYKQSSRTVIIHMKRTRETRYVEIGFTDAFLKRGDITFHCDWMEARDGGPPYLILHDIIQYENETLPATYMGRIDLIQAILRDPSRMSSDSELRLSTPDFFHVKYISDVFEYVLPNYRGVALGVAFVGCSIETPIGSRVERHASDSMTFIICKTSLPEVYELYSEGNDNVPGDNNIAYIPTLQVAKYVKQALGSKTSVRMKFKYSAERRKWTPRLPQIIERRSSPVRV